MVDTQIVSTDDGWTLRTDKVHANNGYIKYTRFELQNKI